MPIIVLGNNSIYYENRIDTNIFVRRLYLRTNYIEYNFEEDIDSKNQFKFRNLPCPIETKDAVCKSYVENIFLNDIYFNDVKLKNKKIVKINYQLAVNEHLTPKKYVDIAIDEI